MNEYTYEYTDTFAGEANYSWVKRGSVSVGDINHYGYDGAYGYAQANRRMETHAVRKVKAALELTGVRCKRELWGEMIVLRPYGSNTILFISFAE